MTQMTKKRLLKKTLRKLHFFKNRIQSFLFKKYLKIVFMPPLDFEKKKQGGNWKHYFKFEQSYLFYGT